MAAISRRPSSVVTGETYATVGTVSPASLLGSLVDLDVGDNEVGGVQSLHEGVRLSVAEETEKELGRLYRPAGTGDTELLSYKTKFCQHHSPKSSFPKSSIPTIATTTLILPESSQPSNRAGIQRTLSGSSGATVVPPHGNSLLVLLDVLQERDGAGELHAVDSLRSLAGVLEGDTEERAAGRCGLVLILGVGGVADLRLSRSISPKFQNVQARACRMCSRGSGAPPQLVECRNSGSGVYLSRTSDRNIEIASRRRGDSVWQRKGRTDHRVGFVGDGFAAFRRASLVFGRRVKPGFSLVCR